jgi:hypothetical protein
LKGRISQNPSSRRAMRKRTFVKASDFIELSA